MLHAVAASLGIGIIGATSAAAAPAGPADLDARLAALEAKVERLRARRGDDAHAGVRDEELRRLVRDVLADTDARASRLWQGLTAGWDGHPFIASADGAFRAEVEGRLQVRYVLNHQDDAPGLDTTEGGFETRRVRSIISGHVVDPSLTYKIQGTFSRGNGAFVLEDAFIRKRFESGVTLTAGQFRPPLTREATVSTFRTTANERAIVHGAIELSRTQGVEVAWRGERLALRGNVNDGDGNANTAALAGDAEFALAARAEVLLAGGWRRFRDFTGWPGEEFALLLGGGASHARGAFGASNPARADDFRWTVDLSAEFSGAHVFAAVGGRRLDPDTGGTLDVKMAVVQGGVFVTDDVEAFARFEWGDDDGASELTVLTIGATRFWDGHKRKWTTDVGYAFDPVSATFASDGAGWREDPAGVDGQVVVRTQLQLMF